MRSARPLVRQEHRETRGPWSRSRPGTRTPACASWLIISPSEAFLPPTDSTSVILSCEKGMTYLPRCMTMPTFSFDGIARSVMASAANQSAAMLPHVRHLAYDRTVFFVSDGTGITAETLGHSC